MRKKYSNIVIIAALCITTLFAYRAFSSDTEETPTTQEKPNTLAINEVYIPSKLTIFNEKVPLKHFDVYESLERELHLNTYWQSQTIQFVKYAFRYFPIIDSILIKNNIPVDFKYLALAESGLRVNISPKGAAGFWQILEGTGKQYGLEINDFVDERYHIEKSTEAACKYIQKAYNTFNSWTLAAASYNIGINGLKQQLDYQQTKSYYNLYTNSETGRYVYRIIALKLIMENPQDYGYGAIKKYDDITYTIATVDTSIADLQSFANLQESNYKMLKTMNPWLRGKSLPNPNKKGYRIYIVKKIHR